MLSCCPARANENILIIDKFDTSRHHWKSQYCADARAQFQDARARVISRPFITSPRFKRAISFASKIREASKICFRSSTAKSSLRCPMKIELARDFKKRTQFRVCSETTRKHRVTYIHTYIHTVVERILSQRNFDIGTRKEQSKLSN